MDFAVVPTPPYIQFLPVRTEVLEYYFHVGYGGNTATLVAAKIVHIYIRVIAHTSTIPLSKEPKLYTGTSSVKYLSYV